VCPACLDARGVEEPLVRDGESFVCAACGERYPVVGGIPVLVRSEERRELFNV
jgi:uncharacterized protein YbaR (Trm112 family)